MGEKKQGQVQGFHNWVYFYHLEKQNKVQMVLEEYWSNHHQEL